MNSTTDVVIKKVTEDWFSVYYRGRCIADFKTAAGAEMYVKRLGHAVIWA